jgi:hypothetical protein
MSPLLRRVPVAPRCAAPAGQSPAPPSTASSKEHCSEQAAPQLDPGGAAEDPRGLGGLLRHLRAHAAVLRRVRSRAARGLSPVRRRAALPLRGLWRAFPVGLPGRVRGVRRGGTPAGALRRPDPQARPLSSRGLLVAPHEPTSFDGSTLRCSKPLGDVSRFGGCRGCESAWRDGVRQRQPRRPALRRLPRPRGRRPRRAPRAPRGQSSARRFPLRAPFTMSS